MSVTYNYGTGRRKSAVARVFIKLGKGDIIVNDKQQTAICITIITQLVTMINVVSA